MGKASVRAAAHPTANGAARRAAQCLY